MRLLILLAAASASAAAKASAHWPVHETPQIPNILHQTWANSSLPGAVAQRQESMRSLHPFWEYKLWTYYESWKLVEQHYAWFKEMYENLPDDDMRAEAARYLYMHHYGGVYTDLNLVGLRSLEPLLENHQLMLASNAPDLEKEPSIPHAWMASARRHPFWIFVLAQIIKATGGDMYGDGAREATTGGVMLSKAVKAYRNADGKGLDILEPGVIYMAANDKKPPGTGWEVDEISICDPHHVDHDAAACKERFPDAYTIPIDTCFKCRFPT